MRINDTVLQDIEDWILVKAFRGERADHIKALIEDDVGLRTDLEVHNCESEEMK